MDPMDSGWGLNRAVKKVNINKNHTVTWLQKLTWHLKIM